MTRSIRVTALLVASVASLSAWAQKPSVHPANGQGMEQQNSDDAQCLSSASQQTGIDPAAMAAAPAATGPQGERLRGAARGAAAGAVVGGVTDNRRNGAEVGAAAGMVAGGRQARQNNAQAQNAQASNAQAIDTYYRAYGACMQGRGYTVQ